MHAKGHTGFEGLYRNAAISEVARLAHITEVTLTAGRGASQQARAHRLERVATRHDLRRQPYRGHGGLIRQLLAGARDRDDCMERIEKRPKI